MYFQNVNTLDQLKAEYRRLAMANHPDHGGDTATMQRINEEYRARFEALKKAHNAKADEFHQTTEAPEEFIDIISALLKLDGLTVELRALACRFWLGGLLRLGCRRWLAFRLRFGIYLCISLDSFGRLWSPLIGGDALRRDVFTLCILRGCASGSIDGCKTGLVGHIVCICSGATGNIAFSG